MWYKNAARHPDKSVIVQKLMPHWQSLKCREWKFGRKGKLRSSVSHYSTAVEGLKFSNIKLIILCNQKTCKFCKEFAIASETLSKLQMKLSTLLQCFATRNTKSYILNYRWWQFENWVESEGVEKCKDVFETQISWWVLQLELYAPCMVILEKMARQSTKWGAITKENTLWE